MSTSSSSSKICYNSDCTELKSERPRKGWRLRTGEFAELCDRCGIAYEEGRFCDTFHLNAAGWRNCESCRKPVHCGCIVSAHAFTLLDPGGIECAACARKNVFLGQNVPWSTPLFFHSPSVKSWSQLAGSGPVPWWQAPTLFNSSASQPEFHPRVSYEVDLSSGIDRIGASERPSFPSLEKRKIESFSERLMNGSLKLGTREILENGHPVEMESFLNVAGGLVIPKKLRKKSKTSNVADKGAAEKECLSSTSARALEMQQRPEPLKRGSEEGLQRILQLRLYSGHISFVPAPGFENYGEPASYSDESTTRQNPSPEQALKFQHHGYQGPNVELEKLDWRTISGPFVSIWLHNVPWGGEETMAAPNAKFSDGYLDLIVTKDIPKLSLLSLMTQLNNGNHVKSPHVLYLKVKAFVLEPGPRIDDATKEGIIDSDGEVLARGNGTYNCDQKALMTYNKLQITVDQGLATLFSPI
ncbi:hypothetical protein SLE2022_013470 [Rubroshorea leprosula]